MRVLELFGGYGSQALALENLGIDFKSDLCEIDKYAIQAYNQIHGETFNYGDICSIDETKLPYYDLITYSSPCQDFSQAGKQLGGERGSGTRSSLLWECERIIRAVKPKYLLMENVKALTSKKFMPLFAKWLNTLEEIGYKNWWKVLNAKDYGVPQNRERVFVVSILGGGSYQFPEPIKLEKRLKDVLEQNVDEKYYLSDEVVKRFIKSTVGQKQCLEPLACASRGRNPDNPSDRTTGSPTEQRIEINTNGTTNTITTVQKDNYVIEPNVLTPKRNEYGKTVRKEYEKGNLTESRHNMTDLLPRSDGVSNTLTTVQKDNYVIEPMALDEQNQYIRKDGCVGTLTTDGSSPKHNNRVVEPKVMQEPMNLYPNSGNPQAGRVYNTQGISPAMDTCQGGNRMPKITEVIGSTQKNAFHGDGTISPSLTSAMGMGGGQIPMCKYENYRIRKLTPRECWRLMGVRDEQFDKLHDISNSQLYKMAGNSIVVDVLMAIFKNLFMPTEQKGQLELI